MTAKGGPEPPFAFPQPEAAAASDAPRVALLFCALSAALPFLLPEHRAPVPSFYDEWLAAALGVCALAALGWKLRALAVPSLSLWLAALAAWLAAQSVLQPPALWQLPLSGIAYALIAALTALLGNALALRFGPERVAETIASFLLAGAAANAAIGIIQFHGVPDILDGIVARTTGPRIVGHVGQGNLYAGYVALGEASLLYLYGRGRLARGLALPIAALLIVASAYSQSRSAILFSLWIAVLAWWVARSAQPIWHGHARRAWILFAVTLGAMALLPSLHEALGMRTMPFAIERLADGAGWRAEPRPDAWLLALRLFVDAPWLGTGWGEFSGAAFRAGLPPTLAATSQIWTSPHNTPLQVLAKAGVIGGVIVAAGVLGWVRDAASATRRDPSLAHWWVAAVVGVVGLHSLVEYPLWYAHVLVLSALCAGTVSRRALEMPDVTGRAIVWLASAVLCGLLAWTLIDYYRFDRGRVIATGKTLADPAQVEQARRALDSALGGPLGAKVAPELYLALPFDPDGLDEKLDLGARVLRRWPVVPVIARHAAFLALAGRREEATGLLRHASATIPVAREALSLALQPLAAGAPDAIRPLLAALNSS
jgi:O-antigen ligase